MNKNIVFSIVTTTLLIGVLVLSRFVVHIPNFTPVAAIALFAGFYFSSKKWGMLVAASGMLISDFFIGFYDVRVMAAVYISLFLAVIIGSQKIKFSVPSWLNFILSVSLKSLGASLVFFILSNGAVWLFSGMYSLEISGLAKCFAMAIPFFKNTLLGDLSYSFLFFGAFELIKLGLSKMEPVGELEPTSAKIK